MDNIGNAEPLLLKKANRFFRQNRPILPNSEICEVFHSNNLLEIGFLSKQCRNDVAGSCIMCDYGRAIDTKSPYAYIEQMNYILSQYRGTYTHLLFCTNGSFFDDNQIGTDLRKAILEEASLYSFPQLEIETHYRDITEEKLALLSEIFPKKKITIELGLETINQELHDLVIMKDIILDDIEKTIKQIHQHNFSVDLNIMLGMPFLSISDQFLDTISTIKWALQHNCNVVLFPINIKPFTLLYHMYENGFYQPISQWLLIALLCSLPVEQLSRITIAWYGNREQKYDHLAQHAIFPSTCSKCQKSFMPFYKIFNSLESSEARKTLLNQLLMKRECNCLERVNESIIQSDQNDLYDNYRKYNQYLSNFIDEV